jgi:hypothetical protein
MARLLPMLLTQSDNMVQFTLKPATAEDYFEMTSTVDTQTEEVKHPSEIDQANPGVEIGT